MATQEHPAVKPAHVSGTPRVPHRLLHGPGPSDVPPRVLGALARPTLGHLDPAFLKIMDGVAEKLRVVFRTGNRMTFAVSGTGSAGMEACMTNLVEPGDKVLVGVKGVFGGRLAEVARRCGGEVVTVEQEWGKVFDQDVFIKAVREHRPKVTAIVHAETSTGAGQPVDRIGPAVREAGGLMVLDCVTSLSGMPVEIDGWCVDAAYSGTQKCLSCPPGLSPVTFGPRAVEKIEGRKTPVQSWYLDTTLLRAYVDDQQGGAGGARAYHHTAPVNMAYALSEALDMVLEEGLENRFARHREMHAMLREGLEKLGFRYVSDPDHTLPMLNAVALPEGIDDAAGRSRLLEEFGIEVGAGLGPFKGKVWRIGLMGAGAVPRNVVTLLGAVGEVRRK